jgi:hypothetical protein
LISRDVTARFDTSTHIIQERIPSWNNSGRPKEAKIGTFGFNSQTSCLEYWTGSIWLKLPMKRIKT